MFGEWAEIYDTIYRGRGKDFASEANTVARLVRARNPGANSLLDIGCGTGEHLLTFRKLFAHVQGLDVSAAMIAVARRKLPGVFLHRADMCAFDAGRRFDAICSLFSSVSYLGTVDRLNAAIATMSRHLSPGGVLVIEPWWFPENYIDGYISGQAIDGDGCTIARVSRTKRGEQARTAHMTVHCLVADGSGIRRFSDILTHALFTRAEYESAFHTAGCRVEYLPGLMSGTGVFVGIRQKLAPKPSAFPKESGESIDPIRR